jgi:AcrR family transcriptional regulator
MVRTRSPEAHEKVIRAALSLFGERGIEATSMDAIARAAAVSKATIYNHWHDKEALLLEVMLYVNGLNREPDDVDTGDLQRDLAIILSRKPPGEFAEARDRMMPGLIAYSAVHPAFGAMWRRRVMDPPQQCLKKTLRRGIERGQLPASLNLDLAMALLLGPILYNHIFTNNKQPCAKDIGPETAEAFTRAHAIHAAVQAAKHLEAVKAGRK